MLKFYMYILKILQLCICRNFLHTMNLYMYIPNSCNNVILLCMNLFMLIKNLFSALDLCAIINILSLWVVKACSQD